MLPLRDFVLKKEVIVVAHRGASGIAPENTMAAYKLAFEEGAQMLEIDLQFTSDNEIIVLHDKSVLKRNLLNKISNKILYNDIKDIDIGSYFSSKFKGEKIPRLIEVLNFSKDKVYIMIEIKPNKKRSYKNEIIKIIELLHQSGTYEQVIIGSFDYKVIRTVKELDSLIPTAAIKIPIISSLPSTIKGKYDCDAFICSLKELNKKISEDAIANNIYLGAYSIDNKKDFEIAQKYKINAIATNYPAKIVSLLKDEKLYYKL